MQKQLQTTSHCARHGLGRFVNVYRCALLEHVPTIFEENLFKDERALNHTRARTHTYARSD
jgi:hypothetical protein